MGQHRVRFATAVAVAWTGVALGAFGYFSSLGSTDDFSDVSGWIIAALVLQIPAFWALVSANPGRVFGRCRAAALAFPAALVGAFCVFAIAIRFAPPGFDRVGLIGGALLFALLLVLAIHALRVRPHPHGARVVVIAVAIVAVAMPLALVHERDLLRWVPGMFLAPLAWTVPLWPLLRRPRAIPEARVRR